MKASTIHQYGNQEVLHIEDVPKPLQKDNEILVKVHAATANRSDWGIIRAKPFIMRFFTGMTKPKLKITGTDFSGVVEAVGKDVRSFKPGDKVMGFEAMGLQSHAEYLSIPESKGILMMPFNLDFQQSVCLLEAAFYALCGVNVLKPAKGQKALVYGGTGAIGSATIQFLKHKDVVVTAVCKGEHEPLMKSLGAVRVINLEKEDFTKSGGEYDLIIDAVGKTSFATCKPLMTKNGKFSATDGFKNFWLSFSTKFAGGKKVVFAMPKDLKSGLNFIKDLAEKGHFKPVIDKVFPLEKIRDAFAYVGTGQKIGNVIISIA